MPGCGWRCNVGVTPDEDDVERKAGRLNRWYAGALAGAGGYRHLVVAAAVAFVGHRHIACRRHHLDAHVRRVNAVRRDPDGQRQGQENWAEATDAVPYHGRKITIHEAKRQGRVLRPIVIVKGTISKTAAFAQQCRKTGR